MCDLPPPYAAYQQAEEEYQGFRDAAYGETWELWAEYFKGTEIDLHVLPIDRYALTFQDVVWPYFPSPGSDGGFDWEKIYQHLSRYPRRFEVAIWNGSILCGLAAGMASRGVNGPESNVTVWFLERGGDQINELRPNVAAICLDAAYLYGQALGKRMLYLKEPTEGAKPKYRELGFTLASRRCKGTYYECLIEGEEP